MSNYRATIKQRDKPYHSVIAELHDRPPTPTGGGGGWEEVALPHRSAVLIWRGRGLLKQSFSIVFDEMLSGNTVIGTDTYHRLLAFWRPESSKPGPPPEPSILRLSAPGDIIPYKNLDYIISNLEWGQAQGDDDGIRTQQILTLEFTEYRADERLKTAAQTKPRTEPYVVKKGDTLAKIAKAHGTTAAALGAMQKPPIKDNRNLKVGHKIVVPVVKKGR
jgi:hypothetical protein